MNRIFFIAIFLFSLISNAQQTALDIRHLKTGDSLVLLGEYSKALQFYKKCKTPHLPKMAKTYEALGQNLQALEQYKKYLTTTNDLLQLYNYGKLLIKTSRFTKADSVFKTLVKNHPNNANYRYYLGLIKENKKDSTALDSYRKALNLDGNYVNAAYKVAKLLLQKKSYNQAEKYINIGLKSDSLSIRFLKYKGLQLFKLKEYNKAINIFKKLIELKSSDQSLYFRLARSYFAVFDFENAIVEFKHLIARFDDKNPTYYLYLGKSYQALHYYEQAEQAIKQAILIKKNISLEPELLVLATLYEKQKQYKKQIEACKNVLAENPNNALAYYLLAKASDNYYEDKNIALTHYENYLKKFGNKNPISILIQERIADLKKELHFKGDKQ